MNNCQDCKHYRKEYTNAFVLETCALFTYKWTDHTTNKVRISEESIKIARKPGACGLDGDYFEARNV